MTLAIRVDDEREARAVLVAHRRDGGERSA
jgi:hypothetical protein